jgi:hypothetical protein
MCRLLRRGSMRPAGGSWGRSCRLRFLPSVLRHRKKPPLPAGGRDFEAVSKGTLTSGVSSSDELPSPTLEVSNPLRERSTAELVGRLPCNGGKPATESSLVSSKW